MATKVYFEPTLFIFLGTSAGQTGWRLKKLLHEVYGSIPVFRFLWVDCDQHFDGAAAEWFGPSERAELSGFNGDEVLANLSAYPEIGAWWPRGSRLKPGTITIGGRQVRLFSRLALFRMFSDRTGGPAFIDKLRNAVDELQKIENFDATERLSNPTFDYTVSRGSVRVYLVFSTCGASGSGMAHDVAYLCRYLLRGNPTTVAVAMLPSVLDRAIKNETATQREKIRANTYAWFKESGYLLEHPEWRVAYPEGAPVTVQAPPFDLQFVVDIASQAGDRLKSADDAFKMAAQAIFLDTGSSVAGPMRGFNANVHVLASEFHGRRRSYSAFAAVALVYPRDRILDYCCACFAGAMLQAGLLAPPDLAEVEKAASALLGRLALRDAELLGFLLRGRHIPNAHAPLIKKARSVQEIRALLQSREARDVEERQARTERITVVAEARLASVRSALQAEIAALTLQRGAPFAAQVLNRLLAEPSGDHPIDSDTLSLLGLKQRIVQQGAGDKQVRAVEAACRSARGRLERLDGGVWQGMKRTVRPGAWRRQLDQARNDCLEATAAANQLVLQRGAQRGALNLYDQLAEEVRRLQGELARLAAVLRRTGQDLTAVASDDLRAPVSGGAYEMSLEVVDGDYIRTYYARQASAFDLAERSAAFFGALPARSLGEWSRWMEADLGDALRAFAADHFAPGLDRISLLEALRDYHGADAPRVIKAQFDRLVRYCLPFCRYNSNSGLDDLEGKSIIGLADETSELIPAEYRNDIQYEVKTTGLKHRIDAVRVQHGLPAYLLRDMEDYRTCFEIRKTGLDPLFVLPEAAGADEVIPDERQAARHVFAVAGAFGYIIQVGQYYYFDATKQYRTIGVRPGRENRLGQGRENAEQGFAQRDELVRLAEQMIDRDLEEMGLRAAVGCLTAQIAKLTELLARIGADSDQRRQFEKEIRALQDKRDDLGRISPELALTA